MITIRISFLLAIHLTNKQNILKNKFQAKPQKTKSTKKHKSKAVPETLEDDTYSFIKVQNPPTSYIHIDYELFEKKINYKVDVVCWGPVAKIFTNSGIKCLKTIIQDDIAWIPVFIEHYLNPLSTEEIRKLLKQIITIHIKMGKNGVGVKAKKDKTSVFYQFKEDAKNEFFSEMYTVKSKNMNDPYAGTVIERLILKLQTFPTNQDVVTWMYNMDDVHGYRMHKIITKRLSGKEIYCKEFCEEETEPADGKGRSKKQNTRKKSRTKSKSKKERMEFKIPAHVLLSDPALATYKVKKTGTELAEFYILLNSDNMLTSAQKNELCPLIVKIRKITNLPVNNLVRGGFSHLYSSCTIPGLTEFKTSLRPVTTRRIVFDESRFIIANDFSKMELVELLETQKVLVKIVGVKHMLQPQVTKEEKKKKISTKPIDFAKSSTDTSVLAVASFDLSALGKTFFLFKEKGQCYAWRSLPHRRIEEYILDRFTVNEMNLVQLQVNDNTLPLSDNVMLEEGTTVKFEAHFSQPTHPLSCIDAHAITYKRLLVILYKEDVAQVLLSSVLLHNHQFLGPGPYLVQNFLVQNLKSDDISLQDQELLSGFVIDDETCYIMFVEGSSNGYILSLLHEVSQYNYSTGKVFYNSEYLFKERLYLAFHKYSGIYTVTLKLPLSEIFAERKIYITGNVPVPSFRAIQKLHLILNSETLKSLLNHDLLPTELEIVSLSIEYGFPLRYRDQDIGDSDSLLETVNTRQTM